MMRGNVYRMTAFDLALIALNPALIVSMVFALVAFLALVFYHGDHLLRLNFILFLFTLGVVCVSRISIEFGSALATPYGAALACVTWLALMRFVTIEGFGQSAQMGLHALFIAVSWWASHRLTWDCTVLDKERLAEGRGLLETAGLDAGRRDAATSGNAAPAGTTTKLGSSPSHDAPPNDLSHDDVQQTTHSLNRRKQPHPHGVWVIYFGMAAIPLFGFGQMFLTAPHDRQKGLLLFCQYLASALALLASTSLLGIRAYLRRRYLQMPPEITLVWLGTAGLVVVTVMIAAWFIPRPAPEWSLLSYVPSFNSPKNLRTHRSGILPGVHDPQEAGAAAANVSHNQSSGNMNRSSDSSPPTSRTRQHPGTTTAQGRGATVAQQGTASSSHSASASRASADPTSKATPDSADTNTRGPVGQKMERRPEAQPYGSSAESQRNDPRQTGRGRSSVSEARQNNPTPQAGSDRAGSYTQTKEKHKQPSSLSGSATSGRLPWLPRMPDLVMQIPKWGAWFIKLAYWLGMVALGVWLIWKYRDRIMAYWQHLKRQLQAFLDWWWGRKQLPTQTEAVICERQKSFRQLANPFTLGSASADPRKLVSYSFHALEIWASDMGVSRLPDQTPWEFVQNVAQRYGMLDPPVRQLGDWYGRLAYGDRRIPKQAIERLRELWRRMEELYQTRTLGREQVNDIA